MNTSNNSTPRQYHFLPSTFFLVALLPALLLLLIQWQCSYLTGSVMVAGQAVLQLSVTVALFLLLLDNRWKWNHIIQFFNGFAMILICGFLANQSYINWQENSSVMTSEAIPVAILSCIGALLLSRLMAGKAGNHLSNLSRRLGTILFPFLSILLALGLLIVHLTGWNWLDPVFSGGTAIMIGLVALAFMLDSYWNIMEKEG